MLCILIFDNLKLSALRGGIGIALPSVQISIVLGRADIAAHSSGVAIFS
jgi:hypothetical protein